ncbi:MAG: hypothetical protein IK080_07910, partial [Clostridia bacterium]|nr:hypothetical protein [Clostridia bacterium]
VCHVRLFLFLNNFCSRKTVPSKRDAICVQLRISSAQGYLTYLKPKNQQVCVKGALFDNTGL